MAASGKTLKEKIYHETRRFLVTALYLWAIFALLIAYKAVILAQHNVGFVAHGLALINALALAKIMVIVQAFRPGDSFNEHPLIYPTLIKSAIFAAILACFKILEDVAVGYFRGETFHQSIADLGGGTLIGILILVLILYVALIPFVGFSELRRVLGEKEMTELFLHSRYAIKPLKGES